MSKLARLTSEPSLARGGRSYRCLPQASTHAHTDAKYTHSQVQFIHMRERWKVLRFASLGDGLS